MDAHFWIWGVIISAVSHGLILAVFLVFGSGGQQGSPEDVGLCPGGSAQAESSAASAAETQSKPEASPVPAASSTGEYEVRAGDTLGAIARRIGCSVERLAEVNGSDVKTLSRLQVGQRLALPE